MRTQNAFYNLVSSVISHFTSMLLSFIAQRIFIKSLGTEYLGLSGLFTNIFSMLAVVELGIGSAIIFNLYKPLAEGKKEEIKTLMNFYKKCYHIIALIIFILSIVLTPFLLKIVGETSINKNIVYIVYFLFMTEIICSYMLSYKRSILQADQKNYIIDIIHIVYLIILNIVQIFILIRTKNYLIYLSVRIFLGILENIVITLYVNKKYNYLKENTLPMENEMKKDIIQKVKGLCVHKIGAFIVAGTDNMIISAFLGVATVGLYANYCLIIKALQTVINQIFSSFKSSIGNLLVIDSYDRNYEVYKNMQFLNFWFAMMSTVGIYIVIEDFISAWLGSQYILSKGVLISLVVCNYVYITKLCVSNFKEAAGIFYEDKIVPVIESITNIVTSIILVKLIGLPGVFCGTIITYMITHIYTYPKIVYDKLFKKKYYQYFIDIGKYLIFTILIVILLSFLAIYIKFSNIYVNLIIKIILVLIIPNLFILIFFRRTSEYKYFKELIFSKIKKINTV